jgi:signal transduction histidine kinase/class 3 adenylate cyclase
MLADVIEMLGASILYPDPSAKTRVSPAWRRGGVKQDRLELVSGEIEELTIENAHLRESVLAERDRVVEAVEEARKELARNLHDGPTQLVGAMVMQLEYCRLLLEKDPSKLAEAIIAAQELARHAVCEIRNLLFDLRPLVLETQGLEAALQILLDRRQKEVNEGTKLILKTKTVHANGAISRQDHEVEAAVFAIVQEAVSNALKHAQADNVIVQLEETRTGLCTIITDDGEGFALDEVMGDYGQRGSLGIVNIRERAELIGGELTLESAPGQGTRVTIYVPRVKDERMKTRSRNLQSVTRPFFSRMTWPDVIEAARPGERSLAAETREVSILRLDIAGFTELTDSHPLDRVLSDLSTYLDISTQLVHRHQGNVHKYLGDGFLSVFADADDAVRAGHAIQQATADFNHRQSLKSGLVFPTRVGIASGEVAVTSLGSHDHQDRTVIGSPVNLAERLQEKATPGRVWLSQATYGRLRDRSGCRRLGPVQVKGWQLPVVVYERV